MKYFLFLLSFLFLVSCKKYEDLEVVNPAAEYAVPIGSATLGWDDVINNIGDSTTITIDQDGLVHLNYTGTVQEFRGSDIADFINQFAAPLVFTDTLIALPFTTPPGIELDYAILSDGGARFGYISNFEEPVNVKITIDNIITPAGEPFVFENSHDTWPVDFLSDTISFKDHILKPTNDSIFVRYQFYKETSMDFDKPEFIGATIFDFKASYIEGFLGQETFNVDRDTIEIDFFNETLNGDVFIEDPKVNVVINNSFGFPIRSSGSVFNFFKRDGGVLALESSALDLIDVDYPSLMEVGVLKQTSFPFDNQNSNLSDLILSRPVALEYEFIANANPDFDTSIRGFLLDTSVFEIQVAVDLPLKGWAKNFLAKDTLEINLDMVDNVESAELKLIVENELPLEIIVQGKFLDEEQTILDSIFMEPTAIIDQDSGNTTSNIQTFFIPMTKEKLNNLYRSKELALEVEFNTSGADEEIVEMLSTQKVNLKLGLKVKLEE